MKGIYFDRFFSDYDPFTLNEEKLFGKYLDMLYLAHVGQSFYLTNSSLNFKLNVLNLLNSTYISDAENNSSYVEDFDEF